MALGPNASARSGPSPQPPIRHANRVFDGPSGRILCVADIRGQLSQLNQLAQEANARAIIHTGDFGFFDSSSFDSNSISERTLRHLLTYSPLISTEQREQLTPKEVPIDTIRAKIRDSPTPLLSEFPLLLSGKLKLSVPVYTIWGACEDVKVLEKLRAGEYDIENLHVIDEATSRTLDIGGIKLRLLGLGGAYVPHKLFDNGDGHATIAGGQGTMWTTALQIGELVDTAQKTYDQTETRLFVTHASPGREGLLAQLGTTLKADLTISAALHFRYASSWNEFSVQQDADAYRAKLDKGKNAFDDVWKAVRTQVEPAVDDHQKILLEKALSLITKPPSTTAQAAEDPQWKNTWNWNLCDAAFGYLVLDIREGRVSAELKSQGFNYAYRRSAPAANKDATAASTPASALNRLPSAAASPAPQAATLAPPNAQPATNGVSLDSAGPSPAPTPAPPAEQAPTPSTNGVNGTTPENLASPKQLHRKKLSNAERRERKAEKDRANTTGSEAERSNSKPASPVPASASPVLISQQSQSFKNAKGTPKSNASPALSADPALPESEGATPSVTSPLVRDAATLGGAKSPVPGARRPPRHPWTLFVNRLPLNVTDEEVREVFADHKANITGFKVVNRATRPSAFVEFKDDDSMRAALNNNTGKIGDKPIGVAIAENRGGPSEDPNVVSDSGANSDAANGSSSGNRGGGHSRGGRGGRGRGGGALFAQAMGRSLGQQGQGPRRSSGAAGNDSK